MSGPKTIAQYKLSHPDQRLVGRVQIPGSKSESNRVLILKQLYFPQLEIKGLSDSGDTRSMLNCLNDQGNFIHVGDAGTAMRFLTAYFAICHDDENVLMGTARMHERPIGVLVNALRELGAEIRYLEKEGYPPIKIYGKKLAGGEVSLDSGISSQYISALMLIAPALEQGLKIRLRGLSVSAPYIYLTANLMRRLGFTVKVTSDEVVIPAGVPAPPASFQVEPDWSSASYWFLLSLLARESEIYLPGFLQNSMQGDAGVCGYFEPLGVTAHFIGAGFRLQKQLQKPEVARINLLHHPDLAQTMAVAYAALNIPAEIKGLQSLRIKETDRLSALRMELAKTGARLDIGDDFIKIHSGIQFLKGVEFDTYGDHRMAMALAPLALVDEIVIKNPEVVVKSYPSFWHDLRAVGFNLNSSV